MAGDLGLHCNFCVFFTSIACVQSVLSRILDRIILRQIWALTYSDRAKYFMTDNVGRVMSVNPSAQCPKSKQVGETLQTVLKRCLEIHMRRCRVCGE